MSDKQEKHFQMTHEEQNLLQSQNDLRSHYEYIASLVERDMYFFVHNNIKKRLDLGNDVELEYEIKTGKITARPKPPKDTPKS